MENLVHTDPQLETDKRCFESLWKNKIVNFTKELVKRAPELGWELHGDFDFVEELEPVFEGTTHKARLYAQKLFLNALKRPDCKKRINHFYRFAFRTFLPGKVLIYVAKPGKRATIQARRNEWVTARDFAEQLRLAYIEEKGDFYKE